MGTRPLSAVASGAPLQGGPQALRPHGRPAWALASSPWLGFGVQLRLLSQEVIQALLGFHLGARSACMPDRVQDRTTTECK